MFDILANEEQFQNQQELMKQQQKNQMMLNKQAQMIGLETWKATSYPSQVMMMKEAGLNPALMYGESGGSAGTTSTPSGGSATGGQAMKRRSMDLGQIMGAGLTKSEIDLNKKKEEAIDVQNINTGAQTQNTQQETKNLETDQKYKEALTHAQNLENNLKENTNPETIAQMGEATKLAQQEVIRLQRENKIGEAKANYEIQEAGYNAANAYLTGKEIKSKTNLNNASIRSINNTISQSEEYLNVARQNADSATTTSEAIKKQSETQLMAKINEAIQNDRNLDRLDRQQKIDLAMGLFQTMVGAAPQSTTTQHTREMDSKGKPTGDSFSKAVTKKIFKIR